MSDERRKELRKIATQKRLKGLNKHALCPSMSSDPTVADIIY